MKVVQIGLDKTTLAFLRDNGIFIEETGPINDIEELEDWLVGGRCDAIIVNLESGNFGVYAARHLRNKKIDTPVIGVSPVSADHPWSELRAIFLENGGDDLLRGPANPRELVASLRAMSRRFTGSTVNIAEFTYGGAHLKVNLSLRSALVNGRELALTDKEREMLIHFASHPGRVLSKESLMDNLYALRPDNPPEIKIIDVFICKLRRKLGQIHPDAEKMIETVWGRGYRLCNDSMAQSAA